ncbi:8641_t:CDS:2, partial [Scutellospora calospora]
SKTLHSWYAYPILYEMTIKEFFDKLIIGEISPKCNISVGSSETIDHIELSQTLDTGATTIQASPHYNKHRCKVGEPRYPVAAIERGKQVVVSKESTLMVRDHDYTKSGIIPSVIMIYDILKSVDSDFYAGDVHIRLKDAIFQPSSPICHVVELYNILIKKNITNKPVLCLYTDDLDYFVAVRTPPQHSWKNPVERIISILNLRLQCIGLMRGKMSDNLEKLISKANTMKAIRYLAENNPTLKDAFIESIQQPIYLICSIFEHQSLKEVPFETFDAATENEIIELWETIYLIDDNVSQQDHLTETTVERIHEMKHIQLAYHFSVLGRNLNVPTPGEDLYYKSFEKLYNTTTTEEYRLSLKDAKLRTIKSGKTKATMKHTMLFSSSSICAKNVRIIVVCAEYEKLRLLFSAKKLQLKKHKLLESFLDTILYTCRMSFHNTCDLASTKSINLAESNESNDHQNNSLNNNQPISNEEDLNNEEEINEEDEEDINEEDEKDINEEDEEDINKEEDEDINGEISNVRSKEISTEDPIYKLF